MIDRIEMLEALQDRDDKIAYALSKEIRETSSVSDAYYSYFEDFASLLTAKSSYVRSRGFLLCCAQARWDTEGKLETSLPTMVTLLYDEKPTVVRQCLAALHGVVLFRPELSGKLCEAVKKIDLTRYQNTMAPLIKKDVDALLKALE